MEFIYLFIFSVIACAGISLLMYLVMKAWTWIDDNVKDNNLVIALSMFIGLLAHVSVIVSIAVVIA